MPTYKSIPTVPNVVMGTNAAKSYVSVPYGIGTGIQAADSLVQRSDTGKIYTENTLNSYLNNEVLNYYHLTQNFAKLNDFNNLSYEVTNLQDSAITMHIINYDTISSSSISNIKILINQTISSPTKHVWYMLYSTNSERIVPIELYNDYIEASNYIFKAHYSTPHAQCCKVIVIDTAANTISKYDVIESMTINYPMSSSITGFSVYNSDLVKLYNTIKEIMTNSNKILTFPQLQIYMSSYCGSITVSTTVTQVIIGGMLFVPTATENASLNALSLRYVIDASGLVGKTTYNIKT